MGFGRGRTRGGRAESLRRSRNSTRIPSSLRKELVDREASDAGYGSDGSSDGKNGTDVAALRPASTTPTDSDSIDEADVTLREARKRQRHGDTALQRELEGSLGIRGDKVDSAESSRARAKVRNELKADDFDLQLQDILEGNRTEASHPVNIGCGNSSRKPLLSKPKELKMPGDRRARYEASRASGSIGAAAAALKEDQEREQKHSYDPLREELRILERRLGISSSGSSKTKEAREKKRRKLREELEADGFDLELQDVLDGILVSFTYSGITDETRAVSLVVVQRKSKALTLTNQLRGTRWESLKGNPTVLPWGLPIQKQGLLEGGPVSSVYVAPHRRREATDGSETASSKAALEAVRIEVLRRQIQKGEAAEFLRKYTVGVRGVLCDQLMQSCIHSRFSTNSLIATQTALCCALGKTWDIELCRDVLAALAVCFSSNFARALIQRTEQPEAVAADTASLTTRHAVVGVCCLYDFGFVSPRLFVELIWRVSGIRRGPKAMDEHVVELTDFRIELLLLLLRLGGEKLRQDDTPLFTTTWKTLECVVQHQGNGRSQRLDALEGNVAEAGRLRALLLELQDLKSGKQKGRLMLIKASQTALRRWLSSSTVFGSSFLSTQFQISGSWEDLEQGHRPELSKKAAVAAHCQQQQQLQAGDFKSAPDAFASGAAANSLRQQAALLRFNTELQQSLFECFVTANSPDHALQLLQNSGHLSLKKVIITQTVAVAMQCCLQEKFYNQFYGMVLSRLCGICVCQAAQNGNNAVCKCFLVCEKGAARYRRTVQRGLAAQASAAHGFSVRRLLNLAKLTAFLIRLHIADLRIVRFLNFDSAGEKQGPMGLSGKLGIFLREICVELLCCPTAAGSPLPAREDWKESAVAYFKCLGSMSDICEAFITILQDVVLPTISVDSAGKSSAEQALKASVVKSAIRTLLAHREPDT
ncbi:LOW QUALITY PROTEIN: uncharacterized protein EMH_0010010 [Eimeria mitis]|uniref:MI domain-containing protein n=1 Tax=Eimeria mitis TaxID=44415 RepID=U6KIT5_9EIME|nr:LOW QUALITY PROTEIN: uncharacterized protein EMH_0010010 [Eimeria mitis]CDJ36192.1 hypothetical protein, conserved [Eimeria mitis]